MSRPDGRIPARTRKGTRIETAYAPAAAVQPPAAVPRLEREPHVWFVSAVQQENVNSTAHLTLALAAALGRHLQLDMLTPGRARRVVPAGATESKRRHQLWLVDRGRRAVIGSLSVTFSALRRVRRGDVLLVVTNPPLLPILIAALGAMRGARLIVVVHDVYPDALHVVGVLRPGSLASRVLDRLVCWSLRRADRVVVIGRDMKELLERKLDGDARHLSYVPNWADADVAPIAISAGSGRTGGEGPLIVQYSGNMGATHSVETLVDAAVLLQRDAVPAKLQLYGWGLKCRGLTAMSDARGLRNLETGGPCPRSELSHRLAECEVALILMRRGMAGISVPSRLYNILAAGKPLIIAADASSEAAMLVREHQLGWVVEPENAHALAAAVRDAVRRRDELPAMGTRAAQLGAHVYSFTAAVDSYLRIIEDVAQS